MTRVAALPLITLPFALAACQQAAAPANTVAVAPAETGYIARMKALPPGQRDGVLYRAVRASGGANCQGVKAAEDRPATDGKPAWRVTCTEGSEWLVVLGDDGTALVTGARAS